MSSIHWKKTPAGHLRGRGLGLPFPGEPGKFNAITDVTGVEVGVTTLIAGEGRLAVGKGPIRTGVTAILPRGRAGAHVPCAAGSYSFNGNGEMTGLVWIEEDAHHNHQYAFLRHHPRCHDPLDGGTQDRHGAGLGPARCS